MPNILDKLRQAQKDRPARLALDIAWGRLGDAGAALLAEGGGWPGLRDIDLRLQEIRWQGVEALARSSLLDTAERLVLMGNPIGDLGLQALAGTPRLRALKRLDLSRCDLDDAALLHLSGVSLPALEELSLGFNRFGDIGAIALAGAPFVAQLKTLDLYDTKRISAGGARALSFAEFGALTSLRLGNNKIGDAGLEAIAASDTLTALSSLDLQNNGIGPNGVRALAASPLLGRLTTLELLENPIGDEGLELLLSSPHLGRLGRLDVTACGLSGDPRKHPKWPPKLLAGDDD